METKEKAKERAAAYYKMHADRIRARVAAYKRENADTVNASNRAWRRAHPEMAKAHSVTYRQAHPTETKAYRVANREKTRAYHAAYYLERSAAIMARHAVWNAKNTEKRRAMVKRHKALERGAPISDLTNEQWQTRLSEYNNCCAYCLRPLGGDVTQDHMTPLYRGGHHTISNVVPSCRSCNSAKGTKTLLEFAGAG